MENIGKYIILLGLLITASGLIMYFFSDYLSWFGKTPLDFSYQSDNIKVFFPIGSMIIISIILTFIFTPLENISYTL